MSDPGPAQRLEAVKADEAAPGVIFQRVTDGETLGEIAKAWDVPRGRFVEWFTTEHAGLYDTALKVRAAEFGEEAVGIADGATPETAGVARLRVDARLKVASKWDRARYGESDDRSRGPAVVIQIANLRGEATLLGAPIAPALLPEPAEAAI